MKINLAELDRLEREMADWSSLPASCGGMEHAACEHIEVLGNNLRPLLTLVERQGKKLATFGRQSLPSERTQGWHLWTCEAGFINGEPEPCEDDCTEIAIIVAAYKEAQGSGG